MVIDEQPCGLRERKRLATRRAIECAVLRLAAEREFDRVTIDDIGRAAGISPRTFFNYFATKDDALIGEVPALPDDDALERFATAGPRASVIGGLGELFAESADVSNDDREIYLLRKAIMRDHPHLVGKKIATMRRFEERVREIVERRLRGDLAESECDSAKIVDRARLVTVVAFAGLRHAWQNWADADDATSLADRVRASFDELVDVVT